MTNPFNKELRAALEEVLNVSDYDTETEKIAQQALANTTKADANWEAFRAAFKDLQFYTDCMVESDCLSSREGYTEYGQSRCCFTETKDPDAMCYVCKAAFYRQKSEALPDEVVAAVMEGG